MEELQIPTQRVDVEVFVTSGASVHGSLFAHESPFASGVPEDLTHLLNDERAFLPLALEDDPGSPFIVNKAHVIRVRLPLSVEHRFDRVRESASADTADCTLVLSDGSRLTGTLFLATPTTSSRTVDKLNLAGPFIPVVSDEGIDFVHKAHVVHVS